MQKDQAYHETAIVYNEGLAGFAEDLAPTLVNEEVRRWCVSVGKQHRFHAKRHRLALNKILLKQTPEIVEAVADGLDVPPYVEEVEVKVDNPPNQNILPDGCETYHNPMNTSCEFHPKEDANA